MAQAQRSGAAVRADASHSAPIQAPPLLPPAWLPVGLVTLAITGLLLATSPWYGYHRDELYFRMLGQRPAWGYVDQPPLTPMLARAAIAVFGDSVWAIRVPAALLIAGCAVLAALIAREAGGGRAAQALAAAGLASAFPLIGGHVLVTATPDLAVWLLTILLFMRALLRDRPRLWLAVGVVVGLGLYNKHLVILLLLGLGAGLVLVGPRRALLSGWLWGGVAIALLVGSPNLIYQVTHGFPQVEMAGALAEHKGDEARTMFVPMQILLLGPPLTPIWAAGMVTVLRDGALRPLRALAVAYPLICALLLAIAGQPYYTTGLLLACYAIGCVPAVRWAAGRGAQPGAAARHGRRAVLTAAVAVNIAVSAVIALPLVPQRELGDTPIPEINQVARDQIGWPTYVRQIATEADALPPAERARAVIIAGNYGEAGAIDRYGDRYRLPAVYSGQNELHHRGPPPDDADVVITVGIEDDDIHRWAFGGCEIVAGLDNGVGVDNEEQGRSIRVCHGLNQPWTRLWPAFQHFD